jgi:hypothetical protein
LITEYGNVNDTDRQSGLTTVTNRPILGTTTGDMLAEEEESEAPLGFASDLIEGLLGTGTYELAGDSTVLGDLEVFPEGVEFNGSNMDDRSIGEEEYPRSHNKIVTPNYCTNYIN